MSQPVLFRTLQSNNSNYSVDLVILKLSSFKTINIVDLVTLNESLKKLQLRLFSYGFSISVVVLGLAYWLIMFAHILTNALQVSDDDIIKSVSFTIGKNLLKDNKLANLIDLLLVINVYCHQIFFIKSSFKTDYFSFFLS